MAAVAERMREMRRRRREQGLREVRLLIPDARSRAVRERIAQQVARLDPSNEEDALRRIESVLEFPNPASDD